MQLQAAADDEDDEDEDGGLAPRKEGTESPRLGADESGTAGYGSLSTPGPQEGVSFGAGSGTGAGGCTHCPDASFGRGWSLSGGSSSYTGLSTPACAGREI